MPRKPKDQVQRTLDYKRVFGSEEGKRVLWDMMTAGHMLHSTRVPGDPTETLFREGERNTVLRVLTILEQDPAELRKMIKERKDNEG